jgi:hypothetical protein
MTSLLVVLHFCAWRKYKRVKVSKFLSFFFSLLRESDLERDN